jgi:hypothetical protein
VSGATNEDALSGVYNSITNFSTTYSTHFTAYDGIDTSSSTF